MLPLRFGTCFYHYNYTEEASNQRNGREYALRQVIE